MKQKGFSSLLVILLTIGIIGIGLIIFKNTPQESNTNLKEESKMSEQAQGETKYANWKSYTSSSFGISFKYPSSFVVEEQVKYENPLDWSLWTTYDYPDRPVRILDVKYFNPEIDGELLPLKVGENVVKTYDVTFKETTIRLSNQIIGGKTVQVYETDQGYETPGPIVRYLFVEDKNAKGLILEIQIMNSDYKDN
jgi:hypothetical protein